jgi:hypothetical protein
MLINTVTEKYMDEQLQEAMDKIKKLREYTIEVEVPEGKTLDGLIPYPNSLNKGMFKIYATSIEEAKSNIDKLYY